MKNMLNINQNSVSEKTTTKTYPYINNKQLGIWGPTDGNAEFGLC